MKKGKYGFINKEGKKLIKPVYWPVGSFKEGLTEVKKGGKFGLINKEGEEVVRPIYSWIYFFFDGLACVEKDGKFGLIDKEGKEVIKPVYDLVSNMGDGIVFVRKDDSWYVANLNNPTYEVLIDLQDKAIKKQFSDESKADEFLNAISSYIEKRSQIKNEKENKVNNIFELLKKQYEKDILEINNSYKDDVEKEFNACYKKSMN